MVTPTKENGASVLPAHAYDRESSPQDPHNAKVAKSHGLAYDPKKRHFVDTDGCLIRDRFFQPM